MSENTSHPNTKWVILGLILALSGSLAVILLTLYRGFGLNGDEVYTMFFINYPREYNIVFSYFYTLSRILGSLGENVPALRGLRLVEILCAGGIFFLGAYHWLKAATGRNELTRRIEKSTLFLVILLAMLADYIYNVQTVLTYNSANHLILYVAVGFFLWYASILENTAGGLKDAPRRFGFLVLAGVFCGSGLLIKWTTAIALSVVLCVLVCIFEQGWKRRLIGVLSLVAGGALPLVGYFSLIQPWDEYFQLAGVYFNEQAGGVYSPTGLIIGYVYDLVRCLIISLLWIPLIMVAYWLGRKEFQNGGLSRLRGGLLLTLTILPVLAAAFPQLAPALPLPWVDRESVAFYFPVSILPFAILIFSQVAYLWGASEKSWQWKEGYFKDRLIHGIQRTDWILLLLFSLPFIGAVGTATLLTRAMVAHIAGWIYLMVWVYYRYTPPLAFFSRAILLILAPALLLSTRIAHRVVTPFEKGGGVWAYNQEIPELPKAKGMLFDAQTADYIRGISEIVTNKTDFKPGDPVVAFFDIEDPVYLLGGVSPGIPGFNRWSPKPEHYCAYFANTHLPLTRSLVLRNQPVDAALLACMSENGIRLDTDYDLVGVEKEPFTRYTVEVYARRRDK